MANRDDEFDRLVRRVETLEERLGDILAVLRQRVPTLSDQARAEVARIALAAAGKRSARRDGGDGGDRRTG